MHLESYNYTEKNEEVCDCVAVAGFHSTIKLMLIFIIACNACRAGYVNTV